MCKLPLPKTLRAALLAMAALVFIPVFNLRAAAQDAGTASAPSRAHIEEVLRGLDRGHSIGQVAVSPDGKQLAWIEGGRENGGIRLAPLENPGKSERITAAATPGESCAESEVAWSPDSHALAFLSDCGHPDGQKDVYLSGLDGSPLRRLTDLHGYVASPAFSPDGNTIAFLYVEGATRPAGALAAQNLPSGVIGEDHIEVQRVATALVNAAQPATPTFATPANLHVYEFDWSMDSKALAYVAADPPGENNWWVARLYTQMLGSAPKVVLDPQTVSGPLHGLQIAVPRWSQDGKAIALIGGLMSDQGSTGGDVWVVSAAGGQPHDLTSKRPATPSWIEWDGNRTLYVSELAGSDSRLVRLRLQGDAAGSDPTALADSPTFSIPGSVSAGRLAKSLSVTVDHSLFVFQTSTFNAPPEIFAVRTAPSSSVHSADQPSLDQLTHFNDGVEPAWGKSVSLSWKNDGFTVQGWLMLPKNYDPAKKYPMIVEVHGGPGSAVTGRWGAGGALSPAAFSALGYFVLQPNPRGSYGQGEVFTQANRKDFGYGDLRDILAGVDTVLAKYPVDSHRVGITGWSYGGFMTMFSVTQTQRFKAAVAGAGISDWRSYYGENSIDQWMIPFFGASVYDDPAVYAKSSAIDFIKHVHTPTLAVVGDRDGECPAPQSFEFWHALRDLHVPTQLVVYPNEGHGFVNPAHRRDVLERALEWFASNMPPTA
jgi:dipeptidyl aminopeptidase/acylaminoacyl peptidase